MDTFLSLLVCFALAVVIERAISKTEAWRASRRSALGGASPARATANICGGDCGQCGRSCDEEQAIFDATRRTAPIGNPDRYVVASNPYRESEWMRRLFEQAPVDPMPRIVREAQDNAAAARKLSRMGEASRLSVQTYAGTDGSRLELHVNEVRRGELAAFLAERERAYNMVLHEPDADHDRADDGSDDPVPRRCQLPHLCGRDWCDCGSEETRG